MDLRGNIELPDSKLENFVLAQVSPIELDHCVLGRILGDSCWELHHLKTYREAREWLAHNRAAVVISECDLPDGSWKDILDLVSTICNAPNLIVSSQLAEDRLWAEVLNLGAYDLLATPFDEDEVLRTVSLASECWARRALATHPDINTRTNPSHLGTLAPVTI